MNKIGVIDTMFARVDMGAIAATTMAGLPGHGQRFEVVRHTVPGFKDLAVECRQAIERDACAIVLACGMAGGAELDRWSGLVASQGIMLARVLTGVHILEVFVHATEDPDPARLAELTRRRVENHAVNAYWMLYSPEKLAARAGQGIRQGADDEGPLARWTPGSAGMRAAAE
jgi:riboflavin synthase